MEEPRDVAISGLLLLSALFNNQRLATQAQRKASAFASSPDVATTTGQYFYECLPTTPSLPARDDRSALLLWQRSAVLAGMKENGVPQL